ncbi:acetyltransferase-like protein 3 [Elsinoe australis]|uniref:Acetyltransferase-like protein 3 n=1 Tax=Elsinoe australis TaxID=40998 RepID=A0A4U7APZ8_9PEZI|nr:acetyltransferase-like protein 3 [Elsinoe australis]
MDPAASKFTAVNGVSHGHPESASQSFTFRPDSSATTLTNGNVPKPPAIITNDHQADPNGLYDNINVGKRKRSPEDEVTGRQDYQQESPQKMATLPAFSQTPQSASPSESQIAESLRRDIAHYDTPTEPQHYGGASNQSQTLEHYHTTSDQDSATRASQSRDINQYETSLHSRDAISPNTDFTHQADLDLTQTQLDEDGHTRIPKKRAFTKRTKTGCHSRYTQFPHNFPESYNRSAPAAESRSSSDLFGTGGRDTWAWTTAESTQPPSHSTQSQAPPPGITRTSSLLNFNDRDFDRPSHDSLVTAARLGTAIAPASAPPSSNRSSINLGPSPTSMGPPASNDRLQERRKMLAGQPYLHFCDPQLIEDRRGCREALERYNNSTRPSVGTSEEECGRLFKSIIMPELRRAVPSDGRPSGTIGRYVMVEAPFTCEYGYNIHLGDDVTIGANCNMQDASKITIGARTVIGPNVKFYCMTVPTDRRARGGSRGLALSAPITIEDDCFIGGDVIILAGTRIGRGSTVGAGSVVSKNVPENCVAAGNPPKIMRYGLTVQDDHMGHRPERYQDEDVGTLMMKPRGYTLSKK